MVQTKYSTVRLETVGDAFAAATKLYSHRTAVRCGEQTLTYSELDTLSDALAAELIRREVTVGDRVGVDCEKRLELAVALVAILKVGAAYVPFDPAYPQARLQQMADLAEIKLLLGDTSLPGTVPRIPFSKFPVSTDQQSLTVENTVTDESLAYIMFTSGSTGVPKAVAVPHRGILRLVIEPDYCQLSEEERILQHSPVAFDASTFEIWGALLNGGELVMHPSDHLSLQEIGQAIREYQITTMWLTAGLFHAMVDERPDDLLPLQQLLTGGDVVSPNHAKTILEKHRNLTLINGYGPTENTTFTCCHTITLDQLAAEPSAIPIGHPINGTDVFILDESDKPVEHGSMGQLCAAGGGLAIGYWNQSDLTDDAFFLAPWDSSIRLYRTGDQVRQTAENAPIEFFGRLDLEVKIRGFRIDLSEIESAVRKIDTIQQATVVAEATQSQADKTLIAYYVADHEIARDALTAALSSQLSDHEVPSVFHRLEVLPLTPNGKVDRKALPKLSEILEKQTTDAPHATLSQTEQLLEQIFSDVLELESVPSRANFFDIGASSIQIARIHDKIQSTGYPTLLLTDLFQYPTIEQLAAHLESAQADTNHSKADRQSRDNATTDIAIVGMAGRFPGAKDIDEFWQNLIDGKETITHFTAEELDYCHSDDPSTDPDALYIKSRGIVEDSDLFDAKHFGIAPKEAEELDPQHRLMLECAQTALEDAGIDPDRHDGRIGIFCGSSQNAYLLSNLCSEPGYGKKLAASYPTNHFNTILGNDKDFLPTRVAYKLNLNGPAVSVQCACSTSLVSVIEACDSLRSGHCDTALAGGVSLSFPQKRDYLYTPDGIASKDGHCRTFDADATGTVFGEGVGLVALRRLDDALADGDEIVAVIRGYAINNDGAGKTGFAAPSVNGQAQVVYEAQQAAGVSAEDIGYVEAHGTATPMGDPVEVAALSQAFAKTTDKKQFCSIGTGKTNVGHLDIAAGVTGLIKTALTVRHGQIPPLLHYTKSNPNIDFENSPFKPADTLTDWQPEGKAPRIAGVSAFGVGGTNAHMVVAQAADVAGPTFEKDTGHAYLFPLSASSPEALGQSVENIAKLAATDISVDSLSHTLQTGRRAYQYRTTIAAQNLAELAERTKNFKGKGTQAKTIREVIFMFPGQGSQHPGMAEDLYEKEAVFKQALDQCAEIIKSEIDVDLLSLLFPPADLREEMAEQLRSTHLAQPAIFSIEYALAQQWQHWGITPACMIGHSIGEFAAACIAGILSLPDALKLICTRGRLIVELPKGAMLSVRATREQVTPYLNDEINLAATNGAKSCVIAAPFEPMAALEARLSDDGIEHKRLHTSHAFHSSMMEPVVGEFQQAVASVELKAPTIPIYSTVLADWMTPETATSPAYWAAHLRHPVQFFESISALWEKSDHALLEVGPGNTLATLAGQNPDRKKAQACLATLPHPTSTESAQLHMRSTLGALWSHGLDLDWDLAEAKTAYPAKAKLPSYPFQRRSFYREPTNQIPGAPALPTAQAAPPVALPSVAPTPPAPASDPTVDITSRLCEAISDLSGISPDEITQDLTFLELGFDSLLLTQACREVQDLFGVKVSLKDLMNDLSSLELLSAHVAANTTIAPAVQPQPIAPVANAPLPAAGSQLAIDPNHPQVAYYLTPVSLAPNAALPTAPAPAAIPLPAAPAPAATTPSAKKPIRKVAPPQEPTARQQQHIDQLIERYTTKTAESKRLTQKYRKYHADPRTASGFQKVWKEMVYQIITNKSKGSRLLDVDGNEYIDILNGFGPGFLGHSPDFLVNAIEDQLHSGYEVGPNCLLALEAAELFSQVTGNERTSFVCTGSEAVAASMRLARTVTRRDKVVIFERDYHGNFDEVLVKGANQGNRIKSYPTAPGVPKQSTENMIVLPYGTDESLTIIREMADELAAVIIEPVQSRRPEFRPRDFVRQVREITHNCGALFVFDEVVTGFRFGPRGAQEYYGVEADLCTYGKVIGGGMPLGVVSGKAEYMDTFDGGMWQYGDASFPEQPVTFFAGTFVRHPLAMASVKTLLTYFKDQPPHFWQQINNKGDYLAGSVNDFFKANNVPIEMPNCGSLMFVRMGENQPLGNLFFYHLREKGVFLLEGFPSYLTAAHSDEDIEYVISAFKESAMEMQAGGFFPESDAYQNFDKPVLTGPPLLLSPQATPNDKKKPSAKQAPETTLSDISVATTEPQREILVAAQLGDGSSCAFNESASLRLEGSLNVTALKSAWSKVVARHDTMRATFTRDGLSMQIAPQVDIEVEEIDYTSEANPESSLQQLLHREAAKAYDLENGPLLRPKLVKLSTTLHYLVLDAHHLVCDGWSYNVIAEELAEYYNAACTQKAATLPNAKQYAEHATEWTLAKQRPDYEKQKGFWLNEFSSLPEPMDLPTDRPYPEERTYLGGTVTQKIGKDIYQGIKKAGAKQGCTLYSTLLSAYQLLLHRLCSQDDIVVCIPSAGQNDSANSDNLVGHCVNFLPLRSHYDCDGHYTDFLKESQEALLRATANRQFTFGDLLQNLELERDPRRMPILDAAFNVERMDYFADWKDLDVTFEPNAKTHVHYSLFMNIVESSEGLRIDVDYNADILDEATVTRWMGYFENLLTQLCDQTQVLQSDLRLMSSEEEESVLHSWNPPTIEPRYQTIPEAFAEQLKVSPNAVALSHYGKTYSYADLDLQSQSVAAFLLSLGVKPGDKVGIISDRSFAVVATILGILRVGAAYVPIDQSYPEERKQLIAKDAQIDVILVGESESPQAENLTASVHQISDALAYSDSQTFADHHGSAEDPAYIMYTSGSTGKPKGVVVPHRGVLRLVIDADFIDFGPSETFLLSAPITFDASTLELWGPLLNGGTLAILKPGQCNLEDYAAAIQEMGVTTLWLTAGLFSLIADETPDTLRPLRQLLAGGDVLPTDSVRKALAALDTDAKLINGYGPTENTTFTTCHHIQEADLDRTSIPIGKPINGTQCYLLDDQMRPVPVGVKGRLFIGGSGLALGYLNDRQLTSQRFVSNPLADDPAALLYDSGDICRWNTDGTIEFFGRVDRQVKIRGFRIEIGEIEACLNRIDGVAHAAVKVCEGNAAQKTLLAFIQPQDHSNFDLGALRDSAAAALPSYMVPDHFRMIKQMPLTKNGKIDLRALRAPDEDNLSTKTSRAPKGDIEEKLATIWCDILGVKTISAEQNFFESGGHSLAGLKLFMLINKEFDVDLPLATLIQAPTIASLAKKIKSADQTEVAPPIVKVSETTQASDTPLFLIHSGNGGTLMYRDFCDKIEGYPEIHTVECPLLTSSDPDLDFQSVTETAEYYLENILKIANGRSFSLGGYSFGGIVAVEIARLASLAGHQPECLYLFDSNNPENEESYRKTFQEWGNTNIRILNSLKPLEKVYAIWKAIEKRFVLRYNRVRLMMQEDKSNLNFKLRGFALNEKHGKLMTSFKPQTYEGKTILYRAYASRYDFDQEMGWKDVIPNLEVYQIAGGHIDIFEPGYVDILAEEFNRQFD